MCAVGIYQPGSFTTDDIFISSTINTLPSPPVSSNHEGDHSVITETLSGTTASSSLTNCVVERLNPGSEENKLSSVPIVSSVAHVMQYASTDDDIPLQRSKHFEEGTLPQHS